MTRFFKTFKYPIFAALIICIASCNKSKDTKPDLQRTVIVYMAADNDLYNYAISNINDMEAAMGNFNGRLIVYLDPPADADRPEPYIMEIRHDKARTIQSPVVKTYPEHNSASAVVMEQVIRDIIDIYPAESYGLILWSHGTGWIAQGTYGPMLRSLLHGIMPDVKTFAKDNSSGDEIDLRDLAEHLPVRFDFIMFDVCLMGGVEVMYELRNKADYIIASAAEVLADGFPYEQTIPCLFGSEEQLIRAAQNYMNHYNAQSGAFRSATISITKTAELNALHDRVRELVRTRAAQRNIMDKTAIQKYDRLVRTIFFDLEDFIERLCHDADLSAFRSQLSKTVIYKAHTPAFLNTFDITRSCGLSCYIPSASAVHDLDYDLMEWSDVWQ